MFNVGPVQSPDRVLASLYACLRWSSALMSICGLEHTVLALYVEVLMTLSLTAHCPTSTRSVWLGFLYTVVVRELKGCGITKVSKKGIDP